MKLPFAFLVLASSACVENNLQPNDLDELAEPRIKVEPRVLSFGDASLGDTVIRSFTIESVGDADLFLGDVNLPPGPFAFLSPPLTGMLPVNESVTVEVALTSSGQEVADQIRIYSDATNESLVPVDLLAGGIGGALTIAPFPIDFGSGGKDYLIERTATLTNTGDGPLSISAMHVGGPPFEVLFHESLPLTLQAGDQTEVALGYTPQILPASNEDFLWVESTALSSNSPVPLMGASDFTTVTGRICDPGNANWVAGAAVWASIDIEGDGIVDVVAESQTDGDGRFVLTGLVPGVQTIQVSKGRFQTTFDVDVPSGGTYELPDDECLQQGDLNIAVIQGSYDDIGSLLSSIGLSYTVETEALLESSGALETYDLVFVACSSASAISEGARKALRSFVDNGGGLYASDLALLGVGSIFPDEYVAGSGSYWAPIKAKLLDADMIALNGDSDELTVNYETGVGPRLLDADDSVNSEVWIEVSFGGVTYPATTYMTYGSGTAVFTAFHTSNTSAAETKLLFEEIVLSM